jgi:2-aminoadipate transaminase
MVDTSGVNYGQYIVPTPESCVNLAVGQPQNDLLPLEEFNLALKSLGSKTNNSILQYGKIQGYDMFRECLVKFLTEQFKVSISKESTIITNGITGALSLLISLFKREKTKVICENPTYFLALNIFRDFGFTNDDIININMVEDGENVGIDMDYLLKMNLDKDYRYLFYLIPFNQNPTSYSLSDTSKEKLIEFLNKNPNVIVFSDEVYSLLSWDDKTNIPLFLSHPNIISLNSFSKIFAPALRLGWLNASGTILDKISNCGQLDSSGCLNPISCAIMHELIESKSLLKSILGWRATLKTNCMDLCKYLMEKGSKHIDHFTIPTGGYFLWVKMKYSTEILSKLMEKYKIKFHFGSKFYSNIESNGQYYLRLSYSWYKSSDYELFVDRFIKMLDDFNDIKIISDIKNTDCIDQTSVYVLGHNGRLGKLIVEELVSNQEKTNIKYCGHIDRSMNLTEIFNSETKGKKIIVDVSSIEGTLHLVTELLKNKSIPLIIGTTGHDEKTLELIKKYSQTAPVFLCSNFSVGINQFKKIIGSIDDKDKEFWKVKLTEHHHTNKKDSPSGTAKTLMKTYNKDKEFIKVKDIEAKRYGSPDEVFGYHKLTLETDEEIIEISHTAKNRKVFSCGCVRLIKVIDKFNYSNGLYDWIK